MPERLSNLNWDELAEATMSLKSPRTGIAYQRRDKSSPRKTEARNRVLQSFSRAHFPDTLSILTMPAMDWTFEKSLIAGRETPSHRERPNRTYICAIEQDEAIFRAALKKMPGFSESCAVLDTAPFAYHTVRTHAITRFHCCSFETLVNNSTVPFHGAWLDFTGTITTRRIEVLADFWNRLLRSRLVLTVMATRYGAETAAAVKADGGDYAQWIVSNLPGAILKSRFRYGGSGDKYGGASMLQLTIDKR